MIQPPQNVGQVSTNRRDLITSSSGRQIRKPNKRAGCKAASEEAMEEISNILPLYMVERGTPSFLEGVSIDDEKLHRLYGCELVAQAGAALKVSQVVIITGQNILNRFFYRYIMT